MIPFAKIDYISIGREHLFTFLIVGNYWIIQELDNDGGESYFIDVEPDAFDLFMEMIFIE